ncbi:MAG: amidohydrolase family protein, partial [Flavobacteriaceae bacterium]|nr:amidohydrolase family protein [Flavobacteriaceae bacterium]
MSFKIKIIVFISLLSVMSCKRKVDADILIINGMVYTGIDKAPDNTVIAVNNDTISFIGDKKDATITANKVIDASGFIVCPGFIDPHTHADRDLNDPERSDNKPFLFQGTTTVVVGNDGDSYYPVSKYRDLYTKQGVGSNVILLTGQGTIRNEVIGNSNRPASPEEIAAMKQIAQQEMDAGAFGISTGLFYAPGGYADTEEVIALAKVIAENDGIYDTHLRDESSYSVGLINAVNEAIEIGEKAKIPIHISHIKCLGVDVWKESDTIIKLINNARKNGIAISANQYPYEASATGLIAATVPRWVESGGKDSILVRYQDKRFTQKILHETNENITRRGGPEK